MTEPDAPVPEAVPEVAAEALEPESPEPEGVEPEGDDVQVAFDVGELPGGARAAIEAVLMVVEEPVTDHALASALELPVEEIRDHLADADAQSASVDRFLDELDGMAPSPAVLEAGAPLNLRAASREALAEVVKKFESIADGVDADALTTLADELTSVVTSGSISSGSKTKMSAPGAASSVSGSRTMIPSSDAVGFSSMP